MNLIANTTITTCSIHSSTCSRFCLHHYFVPDTDRHIINQQSNKGNFSQQIQGTILSMLTSPQVSDIFVPPPENKKPLLHSAIYTKYVPALTFILSPPTPPFAVYTKATLPPSPYSSYLHLVPPPGISRTYREGPSIAPPFSCPMKWTKIKDPQYHRSRSKCPIGSPRQLCLRT